MIKNIFVTAGVALFLTAGAAEAAPITTPPPVLTALGNVTAIYVFADAVDTSILNELTPLAINQIFCNHPTGTCTAATAGQTLALFPPAQNGAIVFTLSDTNTGTTFRTDTVNATDHDYHALISSNYSVYNQGALPSAAASVINGFIAGGQSVTFVGFEDTVNGDYDYNDLIFAFAGTTPKAVPEPITIALFGMGIAGGGLLTYRRRRAKTA